MPDQGVTVVGYDELVRGSLRLFDDIEKRADKDLEQVAGRRASMVRAAVPRVTGRMAASVTAAPFASGALVGVGDTSAPYSGWVEFGGTRGRPYVPEGRYLFPIALAAGHLVEHDMTRAAKDEIKGFRWPQPPTAT
jgi:hypothetical protein